MITHHAAAAASCNTGTFSQRFHCNMQQPTSALLPHAGHNAIPALLIFLLAVFFIARCREEAEEGPERCPGRSRPMTEAAQQEASTQAGPPPARRPGAVDRAGAGHVPGGPGPEARRDAAAVRRLRGRHRHLRPASSPPAWHSRRC